MAGPLAGIRVLDLSRILAGPWCTQTMADLGAHVIKVERPGGGDDTRQWGPPWLKDRAGEETRESAYYLSANRGKHSVTIDISKPQGRALIEDLADGSDVFVENFKKGDLDGKGLGYEALSTRNPGLIYCSITGFGQTGPLSQDAGYDYLIQGMGGLMSITGVPDGDPGAGPQRVGLAVSDLTTGMSSTIAILAALHERGSSGKGQHIDMALLDVQVSWLANQALNYFTSGNCPVRTGTGHPNLAPYQVFNTLDGFVIIAVGNDAQFERFCTAAECRHLLDDPRFRTNPDRVVNRLVLADILSVITELKGSDEWMALLRPLGVPCGPIYNIEEVFESPQVIQRGMKLELEHPVTGRIPGVANPIKYSRTQQEYEKPPPLLGEDTDAVLAEILKKTPEEIMTLRRLGVL
jgi:crotonobetainyl-CoA:carnitine CoA-transferase CaiB-like acyl-CoA transferase